MACPNPNHPNNYLVFATPSHSDNNIVGGFHNLQFRNVVVNGSNLTVGNLNAIAPPVNQPVNNFFAEGLCIVPHCNGIDYWIITHNTTLNGLPANGFQGQFYAYLVTEYGVAQTPVITNSTLLAGVCNSIKANPANNQIIMGAGTNNGLVDLGVYDFDNSTGQLSNEVIVDLPGVSQTCACSFSSNNQFIYATSQIPNQVWQLDALNSTNTPVPISNAGIAQGAYMQLAPDDNIYLSRFGGANEIARIINPNALNPVFGFGVDLNTFPNIAGLTSLPNLMDGIAVPMPPDFVVSQIGCNMVELKLPECWSAYSFSIDWGDGSPLINLLNIPNPNSTLHTYAPGAYTIIVRFLPKGNFAQPNPITVSQNVIIAPIQISGPNTVCLNTFPATIYSVPLINGATYNWTSSNTAIANVTQNLNPNEATLTTINTGTTNVSVTISMGGIQICAIGPLLVTITSQPTLTLSPLNSTICQNNNVQLMADYVCFSSGTSYSWSPNLGLSNPNISNPIASPPTTTIYTVTATNGANSATATLIVNVNPNTLSVQANASSTILCPGNPTTLFGNGASIYNWSGGVTNNIPFTPATTSTYTVTGTDANGCTATSAINITVNPSPIVLANASQTIVCSGNQVTLAGSGASTYIWSGGVTDGVPFTPTTTTTYTVTGTDANGCTATSLITITVNPLPTVTANASQTTVCSGNQVTLTGSGASSYTWSGGVTDGLPFTPTATNNYTVTGTDANGCTATSTITITVNPLPAVAITPTNASICLGQSTATLTTSGAASYSWTPTGGLSNASIANPIATPTATTTYTVTGTDANGCSNTATAIVNVNTSPTATASQNNCDLTATASGTGPLAYAWTGPGAYTGSGQIANPVPSSSGSYTVLITDANGCTATATANYNTSSFYCCLPPSYNLSHVFTNPTASGIYTALGLTPSSLISTDIAIQGTLTVDIDMDYAIGTVLFGPDAEVIVNTGKTLVVSDAATWKSACNYMWKGINVLNPGSVADLSSSTFMNMQNGVQANANGTIKAGGNQFIDNEYSISLDHAPAVYNGYISSNIFQTIAANLLPPLDWSTKGERAILLKNCRSMTIGGAVNNYNTFDNLRNGITILQDDNAVGDNVFITHFNTFNNIKANQLLWGPSDGIPIYDNPRGCALFAKNKSANKLRLAHSGHRFINPFIKDFNLCDRGIITNRVFTGFSNNQFKDVDGAILQYKGENTTHAVGANKIENTYLGIMSQGNVFAVNYNANDISINITPAITQPTANGFSTKGVASLGYSTTYPLTTYHVNDNTISTNNPDRCVAIDIMNGINYRVTTNTIDFNSNSLSANSPNIPTLVGINVNNVKRSVFKDNYIQGIANTSLYNNNIRSAGFFVHRSPSNRYMCNKIDYLAFGMYIKGDNKCVNYKDVAQNRFANYSRGIVFHHLVNEGNLGDIGIFQNNPVNHYDCNNKFNKLGIAPSMIHRVTTSSYSCSNAPNDKIVRSNGLAGIIQLGESTIFPTSASCLMFIDNANSTFAANEIANCGVSNVPNSIAGPTPLEDPEDIAQGEVAYTDYPEAGAYYDARELYAYLDAYNGSLPANAILDSFYLANLGEPLDLFNHIDRNIELMSDSAIDRNSTNYSNLLNEAIMLNASLINYAEPFVQNEQYINQLYFYSLDPAFENFSQNQTDSILLLARDCPYVGGPAVFKARSLALAFAPLEFYDDLWICNTMGVFKGGSNPFIDELASLTETNKTDKVNTLFEKGAYELFPNPNNNGLLNLQFKGETEPKEVKLYIYDMMGKILQIFYIQSGYNTLALPNLANGLYTYKLEGADGYLQQGKLELNK